MSKLSKLVVLSESFGQDNLPYPQKQQRDRRIAIKANTNVPSALINAWITDQANELAHKIAERWQFIWLSIQLVIFIFGLLAGLSIARLVLSYDGTTPINIIYAWLVLAGLPFLLMCFWLLTLLPFKLPVISLLSNILQRAVFKPIISWFLKRFVSPDEPPDTGFKPGPSLLFCMSNVAMQWFGLGLGLGALSATFFLLAGSDLAFAWSSSLNLSETRLHAVSSIIATPFANLVSDATPTLTLIQDSHYFRLDGNSNPKFSAPNVAKTLTQWWPFLVSSIAFYAVLPRLITLLISRYKLNRQINLDSRALPDYAALIARMNAPLVTTHELVEPDNLTNISALGQAEKIKFRLSAPLINWGQLSIDLELLESALEDIGLTAKKHYEAGGRLATRDDARLITQLKESGFNDAIVLVKAWEPPMLEFKDWLMLLRKMIGGSIIVILVDPDNKAVTDLDLQIWRNDLAQLDDPALYTESLAL